MLCEVFEVKYLQQKQSKVIKEISWCFVYNHLNSRASFSDETNEKELYFIVWINFLRKSLIVKLYCLTLDKQ